MKRHLSLLLLVLFFSCGTAYAQLLAFKTDALMDVMATPNLNIELVTGGKTSINASVFGNHKPWNQDMKMIGFMPEIRYWFNGRPLTREFVGLSAVAANYDITWGKERYDGDALGLGLTFGYAFYLSRHFSLECHAGTALMHYRHTHSYVGDLTRVNAYNAKGYTFIPYKVGISFIYILK